MLRNLSTASHIAANQRTAFHLELQELLSGSMPGTGLLACIVIALEGLHRLLGGSSTMDQTARCTSDRQHLGVGQEEAANESA